MDASFDLPVRAVWWCPACGFDAEEPGVCECGTTLLRMSPFTHADKPTARVAPLLAKTSPEEWTVPAGLLVSVCRVEDYNRTWQPHQMRKTLKLPEWRSREVFGGSGAIIFRHEGWFILTRREKLKR